MSRIGWWRPIFDGLAVLIGILAAFGIDAWWGIRQERVNADSLLVLVADELADAETGFTDHVTALEQQDDLIRQILALAASSADPASRLDSLVWALGPFSSYHPPSGALRALESSGLASLSSPHIRLAISRYRDAVAADAEEQASFAEYWRDEISPYWDELFDIRSWLDFSSAASNSFEGGVGFAAQIAGDLPHPKVEVPYDRIVADRKFLNQLSRRILRSWRIRSMHTDVIKEAAALRVLIDAR